ncbi:MAG: phage tail protein [Janthinobacterium lividum]
MMMSLGQFVFSLTSAPFHKLQRQRSWKHATSSRIGARNASQFAGPGDDTITLNGLVAPETIGKIASITELGKMADSGDGYVLVDGTGNVYGAFVIDGLSETQTYHTSSGVARRIEFSLTLKRIDDKLLSEVERQGTN